MLQTKQEGCQQTFAPNRVPLTAISPVSITSPHCKKGRKSLENEFGFKSFNFIRFSPAFWWTKSSKRHCESAGWYVAVLKLLPSGSEMIFYQENSDRDFQLEFIVFADTEVCVSRVTTLRCFSAVMDALLGDISRKSAASSWIYNFESIASWVSRLFFCCGGVNFNWKLFAVSLALSQLFSGSSLSK